MHRSLLEESPKQCVYSADEVEWPSPCLFGLQQLCHGDALTHCVLFQPKLLTCSERELAENGDSDVDEDD